MCSSRIAALAALEREPDAAARFWALVSCPLAEERCWRWLGPVDRHGALIFRIRRHAIGAVRLAWGLVLGEFPLSGYLRPRCGTADCVRPTHQIWHLSHRARGRLSALHDGYVCLVDRPTPSLELEALRRVREPSWDLARRAAS